MPAKNLSQRFKGFPPVTVFLILSCCVIFANHQRVTIRFSLPMSEDVVVERRSISWREEKGRLDYACRWVDAKTLAVYLSREVHPGESIFLILRVADAGGWNRERVENKYPLTAQ